jgi:phosphoglycolate phosphatase
VNGWHQAVEDASPPHSLLPTPHRTRAVLFDLDGTFADTAPDLTLALNLQRRKHGLDDLAVEAVRPYASHGTPGLLKAGFGLTLGDPGFPELRLEYLDLYEAHLCERTTLFPGMEAMLAELDRRGLPWGIVTNKPRRYTDPLMDRLGITARAACIVSGDTTANSKPHPEPMLHAARAVGVAPEDCLYVGDAERDVQAALAAGMRVIVALYGYLADTDRPESWQAHGFIHTPVGVLDHL